MTRLNFLIVSVLTTLIIACAPVDYSQKAVFPEANSDTALIYFYRTPGLIGSTYRFNVSENNQVVGAMAQDSYFYLFTDAGKHHYSVDDRNIEKGASVQLTVEAGKTYYIKVDVDYQVLGGKPVFSQVSEAEAMKLLPSRKYVVPRKVDRSTYNVHAEQ
jgi:hypothetical protein